MNGILEDLSPACRAGLIDLTGIDPLLLGADAGLGSLIE